MLGLAGASEFPQQLAVVLTNARTVRVELEGAGERTRRHQEAAVAVGHRGERAEGERVVGINPRDLFHIVERARQPGALRDSRGLQAVVELDVGSRIGQPRIVERSAAAGSGGVSQAAQPFFLFSRSGIRLRPIALGRDPLERALQFLGHAPDALRLGTRQIAALLRVLREVVQLRLAADDQLPVVLHPAPQCGPVAVQSPEEAFAVQWIGRYAASRHQRTQVPPEERPVHVEAQEAQRRRQHVDGGGARGHHHAARHTGASHDQRHPHRRLIHEDGVHQLVVIAEALAVVREQDDDRVGLVSGGAEPVEHAPHLSVGEGDLAVVGMPRKAIEIRRRGRVRRVRIVEMQPGKERTVASRTARLRRRRIEPAQRRIGYLVRAALSAGITGGGFVEVFVERVEPLAEAECARHRVCADERRRLVALPLQQGRDRRILRSEGEHDVAAHAVRGRVLTGENRRVGGAGERDGGLDLIEPDAGGRERVERRRRACRGAVGADVIGAQRVDRDQEQVGMARRARRGPPPGASGDETGRSSHHGGDPRRSGHRGELYLQRRTPRGWHPGA